MTISGRLVGKFLLRVGLGLAFLPLIYFAAALIGGLVPANADWKPPRQGITVFVRTNGVHTWIMMPTAAAEVDWRRLAPVSHIRDDSLAGNYVAVGFGNRDFYLNTPNWSDLSPRTAIAAALGRGPGLVHVEHERDPAPNSDQRPILLTESQYRTLARHIAASFAIRDGRSIPLLGRGYGNGDMFYEGQGRYNGYRTCNEWTGEALRAAGVRMGIWTPLSQSVMLRLE